MRRSSSDAAEAHSENTPPPSSLPTVPASLMNLRHAFHGGADSDGTQPAPCIFPSATASTTTPTAAAAAAAPLVMMTAAVDGQEQTPTHYTGTAPATAEGASGAREYFHVPSPSPTSHGDVPSGPLFPPQRVSDHDLSNTSEEDNPYLTDEENAQARQLSPPTTRTAAAHNAGGSDEDDDRLSPPRSPLRRLSAEEEQLARLRAYNEMSGSSGAGGGQDSANGGGGGGSADQRGFLSDTMTTILPNGVTRWFSSSVDIVAQQSSHAVPDGVKRAASAAANTIGSGAQHIGDAIEHVPNLMVNAIPTQIMSEEVKQLIFTDFSNTFRSFFHTNILSMPFILRQAGLVGGIFLLTFVAITSEYATEAYFAAKNQMKNAHKVIVYGDVPKMVWGKWYPMLNIFYGVTHLIGFIAFSASNSVVLLGAMGMHGGGARALGLIIPSLIALPLVLMKNAHSQEPLSIMSNLLVITAVILMFVDFPYTAAKPIKLWPSSATEFFVAMGVSVYAFTGIGSAIPVERVMPPRRYRRLLRLSVGVAYAILMAFGLSGFLSYGDKTCSVMTVSLQAGPLRTAVSSLLFFASIMIIPQQTFPLCELSDRRVLGITRLTEYWDLKPNLLRVAYLIFSAFAAFIVPYYGLVLSISGALGCGIVGLVVPAALDYVRRERKGLHHNRTMRFYEYLIVFGLGLYGCVVVVIGVVSGSYQLWINIQTQSTSTC